MEKIACIALAAVTVFPVAACGGPKRPRSETLTITVSNLGFGTAWLEAIAEEFENIYDVDVVISPTIIHSSLLTQLETGYQLDDLCMFAGVSSIWNTMRKGKFMQIDDVWSSTVEGEDKTVAEKALPEFAEAYKFNDHYYSMPFITEMGGIAYNVTTLDKLYGAGNWTLPTTTGELNEMCADIVAKGAYPFVWSNRENSCYWGMTADAWTAQYDGVKAYTGAGRASYWDETKNDYVLADTAEVAKAKILPTRADITFTTWVTTTREASIRINIRRLWISRKRSSRLRAEATPTTKSFAYSATTATGCTRNRRKTSCFAVRKLAL